ncbi:MAG: formylglycine-generating enzyme family protein [Chloroflexota bacterium]
MAMLTVSGARADPPSMIRIIGGPVTLGTDDGPADERPMHVVELAEFLIDALPVTTTEFAAFLNAIGTVNDRGENLFDLPDSDARIRIIGSSFSPVPGYEQHPVVEPSWAGARDYCAWRGTRLPTEAEWERAARGSDGRTYPWGEAPPNRQRSHFGARYNDYLAIGGFPDGATPEGVHELAGNVWHWVSSLYWPYPYQADDGREDPFVPGERGARGGGHDSPAAHLRGAYRGRGLSRSPTAGHHNIGFRCAMSPVAEAM